MRSWWFQEADKSAVCCWMEGYKRNHVLTTTPSRRHWLVVEEGPDQTVSRQVLNDAQIILRALYTYAECLITVRVPIPLSMRTAIVLYNVELCRVACCSKCVESALIKCEKVCVLFLWRNGVLSSTQTHVSAECEYDRIYRLDNIKLFKRKLYRWNCKTHFTSVFYVTDTLYG